MAILTERVSVILPSEAKARIKSAAGARGISMGEMMRIMIDDHIALDRFNEWHRSYKELLALRR